MTKLTNTSRDRIAHTAITEAFRERTASLELREAALCKKCYEFVFPADVRAAAAALPKDWLREDACLRFNVDGRNILMKSQTEYRTPNYTYCGTLGAVTGKLAEEVIVWATEAEALSKEKATTERKLRSTLASVSTFNALAKVWPEGKPFYFRHMATTESLPAIRFEDVNAMLGLTPTSPELVKS